MGQGIAKNMINKHKEVMKYLTDNTGKQVDQTSAVYYLYNLFNEQVFIYSIIQEFNICKYKINFFIY